MSLSSLEAKRGMSVVPAITSLASMLGLRGLAIVREDEDVLTPLWLVEQEAKLAAEIRPLVNETGKLYLQLMGEEIEKLAAASGPLSKAEANVLVKAIQDLLDSAAVEFAEGVGPVIGTKAGEVYGTVRQSLGTIGTTFSLVDEAAMAWMKKDPAWWIQDHYGPKVSGKIQKVAAKAIEEGLGRVELASALQAKLEQEVGSYAYWDVLSSSNLNRSRTWGSYESAAELGFTKLVWETVGDERVCPICGPLDQTVFYVNKALPRQRKIVEEQMTPDQYKDLSPWVGTRKNEAGDGLDFYTKDSDGNETSLTSSFVGMKEGKQDDGGALQEAGVNGPPIHGRCRCALTPFE